MANEGKRSYCRCIKRMSVIIGKEEETLFEFKKIYPCTLTLRDTKVRYYKIYGDEFALSCNEAEFKAHFMLIHHKETLKKHVE